MKSPQSHRPACSQHSSIFQCPGVGGGVAFTQDWDLCSGVHPRIVDQVCESGLCELELCKPEPHLFMVGHACLAVNYLTYVVQGECSIDIFASASQFAEDDVKRFDQREGNSYSLKDYLSCLGTDCMSVSRILGLQT